MRQETKRIFRRLFRNPSAILGFSLLIFFILVAIFAPLLAPPVNSFNPSMKLPDPYIMPVVSWKQEPIPPTTRKDVDPQKLGREPIRCIDYHPFGIIGGRDIFYGVVWGTRTAFKVGIIVTVISTLIGITIGSISGYFGGWG